jgi:hypothetical protein
MEIRDSDVEKIRGLVAQFDAERDRDEAFHLAIEIVLAWQAAESSPTPSPPDWIVQFTHDDGDVSEIPATSAPDAEWQATETMRQIPGVVGWKILQRRTEWRTWGSGRPGDLLDELEVAEHWTS